MTLKIRSILRFFQNSVPKNGTSSIFKPLSWIKLSLVGHSETEFRILASRIKASDQAAFEILFNSFQAVIFNFLLFKTRDPTLLKTFCRKHF